MEKGSSRINLIFVYKIQFKFYFINLEKKTHYSLEQSQVLFEWRQEFVYLRFEVYLENKKWNQRDS